MIQNLFSLHMCEYIYIYICVCVCLTNPPPLPQSTYEWCIKRGVPLVSCGWVEACGREGGVVPHALYPSVSLQRYADPLYRARLKVGGVRGGWGVEDGHSLYRAQL